LEATLCVSVRQMPSDVDGRCSVAGELNVLVLVVGTKRVDLAD